MARGVRRRFGAEIGLAITGIAGPDGGSKKKPVGTVFLALDFRGKTISTAFHFSGPRQRIRQASVYEALNCLLTVSGDPVKR
jgi:PncC family amidohydrolase